MTGTGTTPVTGTAAAPAREVGLGTRIMRVGGRCTAVDGQSFNIFFLPRFLFILSLDFFPLSPCNVCRWAARSQYQRSYPDSKIFHFLCSQLQLPLAPSPPPPTHHLHLNDNVQLVSTRWAPSRNLHASSAISYRGTLQTSTAISTIS